MTHARWALAGAAAWLTLSACGGGDDDAAPTVAEDASSTSTSVPSATEISTTTAPAVATTEPSAGDTASSSTSTSATNTSGTTDPAATTSAPASGSAGTTAPGSGAKWTSPDGAFALAFPEEPGVQHFDAPAPDGSTVPVTAYLAEVDDAAVIASCVAAPGGIDPDTDKVLGAAMEGALANVGATLVGSQPIELQGRPGLEFSGTLGQSGSVLARNYVDGDQVCQVLVIGEPDIVDVTAPPFLDSFEFLQEAA